jgi:hypothetical protein
MRLWTNSTRTGSNSLGAGGTAQLADHGQQQRTGDRQQPEDR